MFTSSRGFASVPGIHEETKIWRQVAPGELQSGKRCGRHRESAERAMDVTHGESTQPLSAAGYPQSGDFYAAVAGAPPPPVGGKLAQPGPDKPARLPPRRRPAHVLPGASLTACEAAGVGGKEPSHKTAIEWRWARFRTPKGGSRPGGFQVPKIVGSIGHNRARLRRFQVLCRLLTRKLCPKVADGGRCF